MPTLGLLPSSLYKASLIPTLGLLPSSSYTNFDYHIFLWQMEGKEAQTWSSLQHIYFQRKNNG